MALRLPDRWIWDFWIADTGTDYHVFYLQAPKSLGDPDLRHANASIGHAVSTDLRTWDVQPDALTPGKEGAFDDRATWTGSVIERDGQWFMFYTGTTKADGGRIQRIGVATSTDLMTWAKHSSEPLFSADERWYEMDGDTDWPEESWRDPWVYCDGDMYHALVTARSRTGPSDRRGVVGHAVSRNLIDWEVRPPLSEPGDFAHLEVLQVEKVGENYVLVFSCESDRVSQRRASLNGSNGDKTYVVYADSLSGPFNISSATPALPDGLYSARLVQDRAGTWSWIAFVNVDANGSFVGELTDPIPFVP